MKIHNSFKHERRYRNSVEKLSLNWDDSGANNLKGIIRKYLVKEFENKCFYCKQELNFATQYVIIEHILDKDIHPQFAFHPMNLTLTCSVCNTFKGSTPVSNSLFSSTPYSNYPSDPADFKIVHAYLDNYSEHLTYENELFIKPYSQKGLETIKMCNLYRLQIVEDKIKKSHTDNFSIFSDLSLPKYSEQVYQDKLNYLLTHLDDILNDLKKTSVFISHSNIQTLINGVKNEFDPQYFTLNNKKICTFFEYYYNDIKFFVNLLENTIKYKYLRISMSKYFSIIGSPPQVILTFLTDRSLMEKFIYDLNNPIIGNLFNTSVSKRGFVQDIKILLDKKNFIEAMSDFITNFSVKDHQSLIDFISEIEKIDFSKDFWFNLYDLNYEILRNFNDSLTLFELYEGYKINLYFNKLKKLEFLRLWLDKSGRIFCQITKIKLNELQKWVSILFSGQCYENF